MELLSTLGLLLLLYLGLVFLRPKLNFPAERGEGDAALKDKSLMIVFGSGGHTTEMLMMLEQIDLSKYKRVFFVVA